MGRPFRRVIINADGSGEAEFEARNPWECLVISIPKWMALSPESLSGSHVQNCPEVSVIRKKCTKCFLHQREAVPTDL